MRDEPDASLVAALTEVLRTEADQIQPSADAWTRLEGRTSTGSPFRRRRRRLAWHGAAAAVSLGLVVAALLLATTVDPRRVGLPAPAETPTAASASAPAGGFRPSQPRVAWTLYRPGTDGLYVDAARASAPYDPAQAMTALFEQQPSVAGAVVVPGNNLNRVASLTYADDLVHLDLAAVDDRTRPAGRDGEAEARRWVEAWVRTASQAFDSYAPVLITLNGRPTRLYGVVDTAKPLFDPRIVVKHPATLYFPQASEQVTSPVGVAAMPGAVGDRLVVHDADGKTVASQTADASGGGQTVLTVAPELAPGDYTATLRDRSGRVEQQSRFTVTGSAPGSGRTPVTDPPTLPVESTLVYYPGPDQHLLAEPRPRTTLAAAVAEISGEPAGNDASWPFGSLTPASLTERDGQVVVDYSADDDVRPTDPDQAVASFWVQSLVHTVAAYTGHPVPVRVTLKGKTFRLFDVLDTAEPFTYRQVDDEMTAGLARPTGVPTPSPVAFIGGVEGRLERVTWYVVDPISRETLYQGTAPVAADHTYAFALPLPAGSYDVRVDAATQAGHPAASYGQRIDVT